MTEREQFSLDCAHSDVRFAVKVIQNALLLLDSIDLTDPDPFAIVGIKDVLCLAGKHLPEQWASVAAEIRGVHENPLTKKQGREAKGPHDV